MKKLLTILICILSLSTYAQKDTITDNFTKTDEVLSEVVKKAVILAEKTGNFIIEQAPDILQEFYNWKITSYIMGILLSIIIFLIGRYIPYLWLDDKESYSSDLKYFSKWGDEGVTSAYIMFTITTVVSFILFTINTYKLIFIITAPKLFLIEYFLN